MTDLVALSHLAAHAAHLVTSSNPPSPTQQTLIEKAAHTASSGGGSILTPVAVPLAWVLAAIYAVIPNYAVAIMGLSLIWMILISPLTLKSTRSMLAMQRLQPELKKLQAKHKDDKQAFAQAQMDLFREHNVSPFGSCLPMLLPLPVFFALFRVIDGLSTLYTIPTSGGQTVATPKFLDPGTRMYHDIVAAHGNLNAFGMNLANSPLASHNGFFGAAPYWIAILVMAGTSYLQSAMMMSRNKATANANPQMRMMKYFAPLFALFCIRFPVGVIIYYATSNVCRILQQYLMYRYDPKVKVLVQRDVAEIEEHTHEIDERQQSRPGYTPPRGARPAAPEKRAAPGRPARGAAGAPGKSRFRDLLAQAQEQAEAKRSDKAGLDPPGTGTKNGPSPSNGNGAGRSNGGGRSNGAGNGAGRSNGGANGTAKGNSARSGPNRNQPQGSRTNRKRRGH
jgi:YidC/Oxa1 family membrane protein insertase